jgi:RES domain-containing protein
LLTALSYDTGPEPDLLQAVDALGTTTWSGAAWRHTARGRNPLSGEGARLFGGRWNSPDIAATVYLAWPERTCLEEFTRMAAGQGRGTTSFLPRALHEIEVHNVLVVDLTSTASLDQVGLELADIQGDDRSA